MKKSKCTPYGVFAVISLISIVMGVFWLIKTKGYGLNGVVFGEGKDRFMDFFNHITYARNRRLVYFTSYHACFPPLIYFMYFLLGKMLPADATKMYDAAATSSYALLVYVFYASVIAVLMFYSAVKALNNQKVEKSLVITGIVMLSNIYIFGILERGNSAVIVCILLINALYLRNSESRLEKELALLFIAAAAGIKLYPAVFGLLYLIEKRGKEALRLIIYGVLGFVLPFFWFGGIPGMMQFFDNQKTMQQEAVSAGFGSIKMLWLQITTVWFDLPYLASWGNVMVFIFLILAVVGCVLVQSQWKRIFLCSAMMVVIPVWSGFYTLIYMSIPLLFFIRSESKTKMDYVYAIGFALIFSFITYNPQGYTEVPGGWLGGRVIYSSLYMMIVLIVAETVAGKIKQAKRSRLNVQEG